MKYNLDFKNLVTCLLPFALRLALTDLLIVLTLPIQALHVRFKDFRLAMLNKLSYNAQYPNLQRLLNDKFDGVDRRIRVYDSPATIKSCVAFNSGQFGKTQLRTTFSTYSWQNWGYRPFVVDIAQMPTYFKADDDTINQITKSVNIYKFSGTKYKLKTS